MKRTAKILLAITSLMLASAGQASNGHRGYSGGHHGGHHGGHGGYIAGGLLVGGLLGYAISDNRYRYREPRPIYRTAYVETRIEPRRSYRKENDGYCYLINYRENGDQVSTVVPAMNCE
ncbi:MAG: hypothetical protein O7B25_05250 [Gammaproteobacteria bacterium]|nr:hypothetical protein [Gammaproteobacteria bacterium]